MSSGRYSTKKTDFDKTLDLTQLKPYGDTMNDGKVQVSFSLPVPDSEVAVEAARQLAMKMGLIEPTVTHHAPLDKSFSFFVVYGSLSHFVDLSLIHI
jgi:beta-lysine 5,6-aminomutase beta subunit